MELFKITCVTCRAGLSVRNESIIGQIVACPRCGSMVEIVSPGEPGDPPAEPEGPPAEAGSPVLLVESDAAAVANYTFIAWGVAILAVGTTLVGTVLFWPSEPTVSDAAPPRATEQPEATEIEQPSAELPALPPDEPDVREEETVAESPVQVQEAKPQAVAAPIDEPRVARRFDPLDLDPERLDLTSLDRLKDKNATAAPVSSPAIGSSDTVLEPSTSTLPIVRRGSDPQRNVGASDAQEQLARRLPALEIRSMSLVDFFSLVSQLSGSPVSVGSEQLLMAGISPRKRVSLDALDIRLDEALTRVLEPLRLEYVVDGEQVIVVRKDAARVREIEYPIDDLVSSATSAEQLADWVRQLVAPTSWQEATLEIADDSLRIEQS
ncbi:MAG: hypothetical protein IH831_04360, partial [Planctomycetes bacterium]|nr:hypothetical protein [Planctomycetota bacterium]